MCRRSPRASFRCASEHIRREFWRSSFMLLMSTATGLIVALGGDVGLCPKYVSVSHRLAPDDDRSEKLEVRYRVRVHRFLGSAGREQLFFLIGRDRQPVGGRTLQPLEFLLFARQRPAFRSVSPLCGWRSRRPQRRGSSTAARRCCASNCLVFVSKISDGVGSLSSFQARVSVVGVDDADNCGCDRTRQPQTCRQA